MAESEKRLPILGHLAELRDRLTRSAIAAVVTTSLSFIFARQIFNLLTYKSSLTKPIFDFLTNRMHLFPIPDVTLVFIEATEMLGTYMRVSLASGIILAMPYITYEFMMFVSPALTRRERKYVYLIMPWVGLMFVTGVLFCYFILLPPSVRFLLTFGTDIATPQIRVGNYISLVTRLMLAVGLVFEMPVVTTFLARLGIISGDWLAKKRKVAIILAFVAGAIITPTFDPINQTLVALPLVVLYELSIWLARLVHRKKPVPRLLKTL
ncbi:MAG: twin-arginine translocase subunit TatC [Chloroflexi bacterium]|nr:twin-arginine translocase subunit TatC [Chloroflexota bacterium]